MNVWVPAPRESLIDPGRLDGPFEQAAGCSATMLCGRVGRPARRALVALHGGQGTINVNSRAPDSTRLAYIADPIAAA